jgi:hypothetical protein
MKPNKLFTAALIGAFALGAATLASCTPNGGGGEDPMPEYTVTFDADGGTPAPDTQKVKEGETATSPAAMTKTGFEFLFWSLDGTSAYDFSTPVTANLTLTAYWQAEGGNDNDQISLSDEGDENQTAYADDEEKGITFTAKSDWEASVTESGTTRASNVTWVKLMVNGEEKYSGGAGTINLVIVIEPNTTGGDRRATITIACGGESLKISVDQKGVTEDNKPLTAQDLLVAHPWKHVISIYRYPKSWDHPNTPEDESVDEDTDDYFYTFGADGILTAGYIDGEGAEIGGGDNESVPYTVSGNTLKIHTTNENEEPFEMVYTITKLTGSELELDGTFQVSTQAEYPDGSVGPIEYFSYTETVKFVKP